MFIISNRVPIVINLNTYIIGSCLLLISYCLEDNVQKYI